MAALEELPPIDLAIHSDTGHEAVGTYAHAEKWTSWLEERGVPVVTVKPENNTVVREDWGKKSDTPSIQIPAFTLTHSSGTPGRLAASAPGNGRSRPSENTCEASLAGES